ncbi:hypothetical protein IWQ47_000463 [Aquimarina sp. EL_43]|uniref:DUF4291 domain-containing protein n=1 Tax=unclassified Aquimarina TaxID=2627091 RepID=UPI0018CB6B73|nr:MULTISPECIES: DUF4291 domain-containing protein [unclassified Aquimarina]MBG6128845.1 hypothetical protein [Aquimarina sp. EL_35]MBG6149908.1 hypothetical protein [Aquimarina sp. EL_32]MBG6167405.1 hypothetical protein [Aquimarina sp. EL_43]
MKLQLKKYKEQQKEWPQSGYHIMAQYDNEKIIVYQSYRPEIGNFAVKNQFFGGAFSLDRMTWIKPNFLWMMYRNGWGTKEGQEVVLAVHIKKEAFENYVKNAVYSSFKPELYESYEAWQEDVTNSNVRLQWDPDHDPYGVKLERRAIQIGLRKEYIKRYAKDDILEIEDVSDFVSEQYEFVKNKDLENLVTPAEKPLVFKDEKLNAYLKLK